MALLCQPHNSYMLLQMFSEVHNKVIVCIMVFVFSIVSHFNNSHVYIYILICTSLL